MAYIGHRCGCGHTDLSHTGDGTTGACHARFGSSCGGKCAPAQPEVITSFDAKGKPIEQITPPGEGLKSQSGAPIVRTCTCDECTALYEQLAGANA